MAMLSVDVADQQFAAHHAGAAALVHESLSNRLAKPPLQHFPEQLCPLHATGIGRNHGDILARKPRQEMIDEQAPRVEVDALAAKGILKGNDVVNIERGHAVGPRGLEQARDILGGNGVTGLRLAVLAGVGKVWDERRHPRGAVAPES